MDSKNALFLQESLCNFPVMIWKWDLVSNVLLSSAPVANFLWKENPAQSLSLDKWLARIPPDDRQQIIKVREDLLAQNMEIFSLTYRVIDDNGNWHRVLSHGQVTGRDEEGVPTEATGLILDQTHQKETEDFARQSRLKLMSFFATLDDIVFICDCEGMLLEVNTPPLSEQIFGTEWAEGENLKDLLRARGAREESLDCLLSGDPALIEIDLTDQAGETRFLEIKTRLGDRGGESAFFGLCHDFTERKKALAELQLRREQLELALNGAEEGLWEYDIPAGIIVLDERGSAIVEIEKGAVLDIAACREYVHPQDVKGVAELLAAHREGRTPLFTAEYRIRFPQNRVKWILQRGRICRRDTEGNPLQMMGTLMDISEQKKGEEARISLQKKLAESEERLSLALEATREGLWDWDLKNDTVFISDHWVEMLGYTKEDIPDSAKVLFGIMHPEDKEAARETLHSHLQGKTPFYEAEFRALTKEGEWKWIVSRGKVVSHDPEGAPLRIVGTHTDISGQISNQKKIEELKARLHEASSRDSLTGVLNRQAFRRILSREADRSLRCTSSLSLILVNFDHFNDINTRYGHQAGDNLLVETSRLISQEIRPSDVLARWSGEEFIILTPGKLRSSLALAEKLRSIIANNDFPGLPDITASFGVAGYRAGEKLEDLIQRVDIALYKAKTNRGNGIASQQ